MARALNASRHFRYRAAVAGEELCAAPDGHGLGGCCTRPAGHRGPHAAHGEDPDVPLETWAASSKEGGSHEK